MLREEKGRQVLYRVAFLLLFAVLAAVIVGQSRSLSKETERKSEERAALIASYRRENEEMTKELEAVRAETATIRNAYDLELAQLKINNKEFYELYRLSTANLDNARKMAGLTTVQGAGLIIRLDDSGLVQGTLVHDSYLIDTVNVLKEAGAQAISVNGQRVLATTELLCLGPSIRVNGSKEFAPYHILAIGDPETLLRDYQASAVYKTIVSLNLIYDVQQSKNLVIPSYGGNYKSLITKLFA